MYHQFLELRMLWFVLLGLWLARLSPVLASGFGKCPNYPSMPKFNMTKFRNHVLQRSCIWRIASTT
ncbi:AGAP005223-PA-like protein [Anopheles sinensis]|uniref:AGAP005223-PA-like protein n=1 Tax=Anopheles sinensis TaxID=74873 RepID=A0A084WCP4_ANOSI|nr:AGAP005223-PA-like protein [Anopheles sinensis]